MHIVALVVTALSRPPSERANQYSAVLLKLIAVMRQF